MVLLVQPRIQLAFWAVSTHCQVMLSFLLTDTHKSFLAVLLSIHYLPSLYLCLKLPLPTCRTLHLALLNFMRFTWTHFSSLSRSLWMAFLKQNQTKMTMKQLKLRYQYTFTLILLTGVLLYCSLIWSLNILLSSRYDFDILSKLSLEVSALISVVLRLFGIYLQIILCLLVLHFPFTASLLLKSELQLHKMLLAVYFSFLSFPGYVVPTNVTHSAGGTGEDRSWTSSCEVLSLEYIAALKSIYFVKQ